MKEMKKTFIISMIVCALPVIAGIILYPSLPERIVTHWNAAGEPNGWSDKFVGAIVLPAGLLVLQAVFPFLLKTDPKYDNIGSKMKAVVMWIIPVVSWFCAGSTLCAALGINFRIELAGTLFIGIVFLVIGNYLPKTKQSYTVGIKIPWTLSSEENWNRTHRFAGFIWMLAGLVTVISAWFPFRNVIIVIVLIAVVIVPCAYSYILYKKGI